MGDRLPASLCRAKAFQELIAQIMERREPGFQRVQPWGNQGDRENDGWWPERQLLFQSRSGAGIVAPLGLGTLTILPQRLHAALTRREAEPTSKTTVG